MKNNVALLPEDSLLTERSYALPEPVKSSLEIYSREIDKNMRQVLTLAKSQLLSLTVQQDPPFKKNPYKLVGTVVTNLEDLGKKLSCEDVVINGFADSIIRILKRLFETGFCVVKFSVRGKVIKLEPIKELVIFCILQQLIYPGLNIYDPGTVALVVRYQKNKIGIELTRERNNQPLILDIEEMVKLKQRLKSIGGTISYKGQQWETLKIIVNTV